MVREDLKELNHSILAHFCILRADMDKCLPLISVCIGRPRYTESMLRGFVPGDAENPLEITRLNKLYLEFARMVAGEVLQGEFEGMFILGIDIGTARALAALTAKQITTISHRFNGLLFKAPEGLGAIEQMHQKALPHYAASLLSAA